VNPTAPGAGAADLLTRTTLQLDANLPIPSIAGVTRALQRVPGVLLAEVNAASSRAFVAHDSGVRLDALLEAAAGAGVRARVETPRVALSAERPVLKIQTVRFAQLSALAMVPLVLFAAGSLFFRNGAITHWPILFCCLTIGMLALFRRGA
jgi:copper chaperone CopZ